MLVRIGGQFLDPFAQHVLMDIEVPGSLCRRHPPILDQPYRLDLELTRENFLRRIANRQLLGAPYLGVHGKHRGNECAQSHDASAYRPCCQ
jgi:hypothetical protein